LPDIRQNKKKKEPKKGAMFPGINTLLSSNGRFAIFLSMFSHVRIAGTRRVGSRVRAWGCLAVIHE